MSSSTETMDMEEGQELSHHILNQQIELKKLFLFPLTHQDTLQQIMPMMPIHIYLLNQI